MYQSPIVSAHPFLAAGFDPILERFALGAADGRVRLYDASTTRPELLHTVDLAQPQYRGKASESPGKGNRSPGSGCVVVQGGSQGPKWLAEMEEQAAAWLGDDEEVVDEVEQGLAVIAVAFVSPPAHHESWAVAEGPTLLIGTPARVMLLDSLSLESLAVLDFQVEPLTLALTLTLTLTLTFQVEPPNEPPPAPSVSMVGAYAMSAPVQTVSGWRADGAAMR